MKKTALDDDASIYQKRVEETEKEKWNKMNGSQRWQYFRDYYLVKVIVGIVLVVFIGSVVWSMLKPKDEFVLYVAVVDEQFDDEKEEVLTRELNELFEVDGKRYKVFIDDLVYLNNGGMEKLQTLAYNNRLDVVIADEKNYQKLAGMGFFCPVDEFLGEEKAAEYRGDFVETAGYKENKKISFEDMETGRGEVLPYGVDISESKKFSEMKNYLENPILSFVVDNKNPENAVKFLDYIMSE